MIRQANELQSTRTCSVSLNLRAKARAALGLAAFVAIWVQLALAPVQQARSPAQVATPGVATAGQLQYVLCLQFFEIVGQHRPDDMPAGDRGCSCPLCLGMQLINILHRFRSLTTVNFFAHPFTFRDAALFTPRAPPTFARPRAPPVLI
jgi:hypothetical protein